MNLLRASGAAGAVLCAACAATAVTVQFPPYIGDLRNNSVVILWRTIEESPSVVDYGLARTSLTNMAGNTASVRQHKVQLSGLSPDTKYYYRVRSGDYTSDTCYFTTHGPSRKNGFKFMEISDTQNEDGTTDPYSALGQVIEQVDPDFVISAGDNAQWANMHVTYGYPPFFEYFGPWMSHIPFYTALGNHDYWYAESHDFEGVVRNDPRCDWIDTLFCQPSVDDGSADWYYSFFWGGCRFVMTNTGFWGCHDQYAPGQTAWLTSSIGTSPHPYKFQVWSQHHDTTWWGLYCSPSPKPAVENVLYGSKTDLVFEGHLHAWAQYAFGGVQFVRPGRYDQFAVVEVKGDTMTVTAKELPGTVLGTFRFVSPNPSATAVFSETVVSPSLVTIGTGSVLQLSASARDQFGDAVSSQPAFTWSMGGDCGTVSSAGLFTAGDQNGECVVKASGTVGSVTRTGIARIRVMPGVTALTQSSRGTDGAYSNRVMRIRRTAEGMRIEIPARDTHAITVLDMSGRIVYRVKESAARTHTIELSRMPPGVYLVSYSSACIRRTIPVFRY